MKPSRVETFVRYTTRDVEVDCQNRDSLKEDVCLCLAYPKTFRRFLTSHEQRRRCHSYFMRMISRTSSESDSSCNRVSNAIGSVDGLISFTSSSLNTPLAFRRLPDSNVGSKIHLHRFLTRTTPSLRERDIQAWSDCLPTS